jgi:hypothetical protein
MDEDLAQSWRMARLGLGAMQFLVGSKVSSRFNQMDLHLPKS